MCWGHYITDGISKLWCINNPEIRALIIAGVRVAFTSEWINVQSMPIPWRHIVDLLGWKDVEIQTISKITKYKNIYIPTNAIQHGVSGRKYTVEFCDLIDALTKAALERFQNNRIFDKIYLSRTKLTSDHLEYGERNIEKLFKKVGFKILYPERMSFEEQVWCLNNAKIVAGTMGSISHNFMFCKHGTEAIILRKAWYTNDFQYVINQATELNVTYIDVNLSVFLNEITDLGKKKGVQFSALPLQQSVKLTCRNHSDCT